MTEVPRIQIWKPNADPEFHQYQNWKNLWSILEFWIYLGSDVIGGIDQLCCIIAVSFALLSHTKPLLKFFPPLLSIS